MDARTVEILLYCVIALVLIFDFINGFHDSANSIATVVSTKVLSPVQAVFLAAFFNFVAIFIFSLRVASTIGKGIVQPEFIDLHIIIAGLIAAITWNLLTWWWGLPSSSSHTLVGGIVGAAMMKAGFKAVIWFPGVSTIILFIFVAPLLGMAIAFLISGIVIFFFKNTTPTKVDNYFRRIQLFSASTFSLGHGGNDAQKSMGIIWAALIVTHHVSTHDNIQDHHYWVIISCYSAIALGTLLGGWRIVKTMGQKITKLKPFEGVCAETAGAITLFGASAFGIPVSTTHTITGAIMGVGARKSISAVKWGVARNIVWAWLLTIPVSAAISAIAYLILKLFI